MIDDLLVQLFYAAQGDITQFRIKARALLADGGKGEAVGEIAHDELNGFHFAPSVHWLQIGIGTKLYTAPPAECAPRDVPEALYEVLMRRNIECGSEAYLTLRCVGVPPTKNEFVRAIEQAAKEKA